MDPNDDQMAESDVVDAMLRLAERASEPRDEDPPDDATQRDSGWWCQGELVEGPRSLRRRRTA